MEQGNNLRKAIFGVSGCIFLCFHWPLTLVSGYACNGEMIYTGADTFSFPIVKPLDYFIPGLHLEWKLPRRPASLGPARTHGQGI